MLGSQTPLRLLVVIGRNVNDVVQLHRSDNVSQIHQLFSLSKRNRGPPAGTGTNVVNINTLLHGVNPASRISRWGRGEGVGGGEERGYSLVGFTEKNCVHLM